MLDFYVERLCCKVDHHILVITLYRNNAHRERIHRHLLYWDDSKMLEFLII